MKKGIFVLVLAIIAGCAAFCVMRGCSGHDPGTANVLDAMPELEWLKRDLNLSDAQFAKVSELHAAYRPVCDDMCRRIAIAHAKLDRIANDSRGISPEMKAAMQEHADLHVECQSAMLEHLYRTAALLDEKQAARFLESTLPFALEFSSSESGDHHSH